MSAYAPPANIFLRPEEFTHDAEARLGKANGNTYNRRPGVEGAHDGQIMIRLKKRRFIILDYGYVPTSQDKEVAKSVPHINIPNGAGRIRCSTKGCKRIGVPCMLYDSDPTEPMSPYAKSGMCFSCQRAYNEKRRTSGRKRPAEAPEGKAGKKATRTVADAPAPPPLKTSRFKFNDQIIELNPDAIVINGPVEGTRVRGLDYRCPEIGSDLLRIVSELSQETLSLMHHSGTAGLAQPLATTSSVEALYQRAFQSVSKATFLLTQWKASWDENNAAAINDSRVLQQAVASHQAVAAHHHGLQFGHALPAAHQGYPYIDPVTGIAMQPLMMPEEHNSKVARHGV